MTALPHAIIDVFAADPFEGSPVAVVLDADDLAEDQLRRLADWLPVQETAFLVAPTDPRADLRFRTFVGPTEIRFGGLSVMAACRAWLDHGGRPSTDTTLVVEADTGLTRVHVESPERMSFSSPAIYDRGQPDDLTVELVCQTLGLDADAVRGTAWLDSGPGFLGLLVDGAETVTQMEPNIAELGHRCVAVIGPQSADRQGDLELRAFAPSEGADEITAAPSLCAALACWLVPQGRVPEDFVVTQGAATGHDTLLEVSTRGPEIWVGGSVVSRITGGLTL